MTRTVEDRIRLIDEELHDLRNAGPGVEGRRQTLRRQRAMLTEDKRPELVIPSPRRGRYE
ncbi:hypothetical protein GCM10007989_07510 [Devosia pacifica]|uniref:Uncharacterized protein n=1 Tax=Devosia pacifica TaxID=1335967 RepID=A0A918S009_9HYPH|nr:hypothetical protein [Devosia pacifica]GHA15248.1 hypothetical protein GCM10007989_07510 [Devosia pacifica]